MTPEQIAELEAAEQAATPAPWEHIASTSYGISNRTRNVGPMVTGVAPQSAGGGVLQFRGSPSTTDADAHLIVLARDHIADLLAERKRLREGLLWALDLIDRYDAHLVGAHDDPAEKVYSPTHLAGMANARAALRDQGDAP